MVKAELQSVTIFRMKALSKVMTLITAPVYLAAAGLIIHVSVGMVPEHIRGFLESPSFDLLLIFGNFILVFMLLFYISIMLYQFIFKVGFAFLSYVKTSPDWLEVRHWPDAAVRCRWADIERMGKTPSWGASYHQFWLANSETVPYTLFLY